MGEKVKVLLKREYGLTFTLLVRNYAYIREKGNESNHILNRLLQIALK